MNARCFRSPFAISACLTALSLTASAQVATTVGSQEISATSGSFAGPLADVDLFGRSAAALGDLDGDGIGDLAVGAMGDSVDGSNRGAVWVLFLNADGSVKAEQKISGTSGGFAGPLIDGDRFGRSVAAVGDLDGDGRIELAVGAFLDDDGGAFQDRGAVWLLSLNTDGTVFSERKISQTSGGFSGTIDVGDRFGISLAALGDLDNDGVADLAVGADRNDDGGGNDTGAIWVLFLNADGTVKTEQKISNTDGGFTGAMDIGNRNIGVGAASLVNVGDLNADGIADLVSGETGSARSGDTLWVLFLNANGTVKNYSRIASGLGGFPDVLMMGDAFGASLANMGDINADGKVELAVGTPGDDDGGSGRGAVYLLSMNSDGTVADSTKFSATQGGFGGVLSDDDLFGSSVAALGDLDGDGTTELGVGAHFSDDGGDRRGSVWVLFLERNTVAPSFTSDACGDLLTAMVGQQLTFVVSTDDQDAGDSLLLEVSGLPVGATTLPMLPAMGMAPSSVVRWTPMGGDVGQHAVTFSVTDSFGDSTQCSVTIEVLANACATGEFNRRQPGSLLLFPEYMNGPGRVSLLTVTNSNCDALDGAVNIEYRYIDGEDCSKNDRTALLTPCDTLSLLTNVHTDAGHGYAYVYAKSVVNTDANSNGDPIAFNHLIGQVTIIDSWNSLDYSVNAVSFQAIGAEGESTDLDLDGVRDLDGAEYSPAPDRILIPRFLGSDSGPSPMNSSELILIALSGGRSFVSTDVNPSGGTVVDFLIYNDNEQVFSAEHRFDCWAKPRLVEISNIFLNDFLLDSTQHDPSESVGGREAGWMVLDGAVANSVADSIDDPAIYAVLIEHVRATASADLPFEYCSQTNGDLLPAGIFGDGPNAGPGDGK